MKIHTSKNFFLLLTFPVSMFLAGCIPMQPVETTQSEQPIEPPKIEIRNVHPPTEHIFTCLDRVSSLSSADKRLEFDRTKEAFIASNSDEDRLELICLSMARVEEPDFLDYAQELIKDMQNTKHFHPDIQGLSALLNDFSHLQQKRVTDIRQAQQQVHALKKQLEELKSIEKILNERKNIN